MTAHVNALTAWIGLQVAHENCVRRICNLTAQTGKGIDGSAPSRCWSTPFPIGFKPDAIFMSRRSRSQLQASRTVALYGQGPTCPNQPTIALIPTEYDGIPLVASDSILNTDAIESQPKETTTMIRSIKDADLIVTKALPAAGASNNSDTITLGTEPPEELQVELSVPALPSLADTKTATFTFQDSADNPSFAAIPELATLVMTGSGGAMRCCLAHRVAPARRQVLPECRLRGRR